MDWIEAPRGEDFVVRCAAVEGAVQDRFVGLATARPYRFPDDSTFDSPTAVRAWFAQPVVAVTAMYSPVPESIPGES